MSCEQECSREFINLPGVYLDTPRRYFCGTYFGKQKAAIVAGRCHCVVMGL